MNTFSRLLLLAAVCLLVIEPAWAQSDVSGSSPQSDVSGSIATQSDGISFQSDKTQIRINDVAASLTQALQNGQLGPSVIGGSQSVLVSPTITNLFVASSAQDGSAATQQFIDTMTAGGLSNTDATALAQTLAGLLDGGTVSIGQFREALTVYNATVDAAPADFLVQPPHEFIVVRAVLMTLLEGAT